MIRHQLTINKHSKGDLQELYDLIKKGEDYAEIFICDRKVTRSERQRRYYFKVICHIVGEYVGCSKSEANEILKQKFNPGSKVLPSGETIVFGKSIEEERSSRCEEIFEEIRQTFAELDVYIPEPQKIPPSYYVKCTLKE